jgi:divalent metal cation (Fe/Co/Zn/Cd) transporter
LLVSLTGWLWLDPVIALIVAANILFTGISLLRRSGKGLLDASIPEPEVELIKEVLRRFKHKGAQFHALRTRTAGARSFASLHVLVPGDWSVQRSHDLVLELESAIHEQLPNLTLFSHVEPQEDPASWRDTKLTDI